MAVLTISEPVVLACSECPSGYYVETDPGCDTAACALCKRTVTPSFDIARFLDHNEHMVWVDDTTMRGPRWLAYFTEETEEEDGIDY